MARCQNLRTKTLMEPVIIFVLIGHVLLVLLGIAWWISNFGKLPDYGNSSQYLRRRVASRRRVPNPVLSVDPAWFQYSRPKQHDSHRTLADDPRAHQFCISRPRPMGRDGDDREIQ